MGGEQIHIAAKNRFEKGLETDKSPVGGLRELDDHIHVALGFESSPGSRPEKADALDPKILELALVRPKQFDDFLACLCRTGPAFLVVR